MPTYLVERYWLGVTSERLLGALDRGCLSANPAPDDQRYATIRAQMHQLLRDHGLLAA